MTQCTFSIRSRLPSRYSAFAVNPSLDPLSLGHFSPILRRFSPVFSPSSPSCPQDSRNRHQDPEKRSETAAKRSRKGGPKPSNRKRTVRLTFRAWPAGGSTRRRSWAATTARPTSRTAHSSKERRRPLFWQPFWTVTEPPPGLLVPLSGILASRRRKPRKNEKKRGKNGRDMA